MNAKDFLSDLSDQSIRNLFKGFLTILEQLHLEHRNNFTKLYESLPEKYHDLISMSDYFDEEKFSFYRKKTLDLGNETLRNQLSDIEKFEIKFIFNKKE